MRTHAVERGILLLGDNRAEPYNDSREFGEVDPARCHREVFMLVVPAPRQNDDIRRGYFDYVH